MLAIQNCIVFNDVLQDWDDYGIDWAGPVPIDHDADTVELDNIEEILSTEQRSELEREIHMANTSCSIAEDVLVHQYSTAKSFVQSLLEM